MPNGLENTAGTTPAAPPSEAPLAEPVDSPPGPRLERPIEPGDLGALGQYRVVQVLGKGGMGIVYLGIDTQIRRKVALKTMLPKYASSRSARERFLKEARAAGALHHDNVVVIYQVGEASGTPFIAMEHLEGESLEVHLRTHPTPPLPQVVKILREVASGLATAHRNGVIHRDVKPDNIWLEAPSGRVKLLDFGLARVPDISGAQSGTIGLIGTPAYMSPEQARGTNLDHRTDLFSLGAVAYELVVGRPPFTGGNMFDVLAGVMSRNPIPPRQIKPYIPASLDTLILRLLAKDADARPQSAGEIESALTRIQAELSPASPTGEPAIVYVPVPVSLPGVDAGQFAVPGPPLPAAVAPPLGGGPPLPAAVPVPAEPVARPESGEPLKSGSTWSGLATAAAEHPPWVSPPTQATGSGKASRPLWKYAVAALTGICAVFLTGLAIAEIFGPSPPSTAQTTPTPPNQTPSTQKVVPRSRFALLDPAFVEKVKNLPPADQAKTVADEIRRRNPKFASSLDFPSAESRITRVSVCTDFVTDITPIRALPHLTQLRLYSQGPSPGMLADLSPLTGLPLSQLTIHGNPIADLSPIAQMPLETLEIRDANVENLTPLRSMKTLRVLNLSGCRWVTNLEPLRGLQLKSFDASNTMLEKVEPLGESPLETVRLGPKVADVAPLSKCPLADIAIDPPPDHDSPLRGMALKTINRMSAEDYWKRADLRKNPPLVTPFAIWNVQPRQVSKLSWPAGSDLLAVGAASPILARNVGVGLTPWKSPKFDDSNSNGRWIGAVGDRLALLRGHKIRFFDPKTGEETGEPLTLPRESEHLTVSSDGSTLAHTLPPVENTTPISIRFLKSKKEPLEVKIPTRWLKTTALSRTGTRLAVGAFHGLRIWDVANDREIFTNPHIHDTSGLEFSPDERRLLLHTLTGDVMVYDLLAEKKKEPIYRLSGSGVSTARFTPDGGSILVGWNDGWVGIYPLDRRGPSKEFLIDDRPVRHLAFSPDGKTLVTASEHTVRVWNWSRLRDPEPEFKPAKPPAGYTPLFNGTDLAGWSPRDPKEKDVWCADHGLIVGSSFEPNHYSWLTSEAEYADFELRLEYRWTSLGGDAGISFRTKRHGWPPFDGLEFNLVDDANFEETHGYPAGEFDRTGALVSFAKPLEKSHRRVGEWNTVRITAKGKSLVMEQNGKVIQNVDLAKIEAGLKEKEKDKEKDQFRGLKQTRGVLGLQVHGGRIEFRNVFVKDLAPEPPKK